MSRLLAVTRDYDHRDLSVRRQCPHRVVVSTLLRVLLAAEIARASTNLSSA